jgi:hypothetical protein
MRDGPDQAMTRGSAVKQPVRKVLQSHRPKT